MSIYKLGELIILNKQTITKGNKYNYIQLGNIKNQNYKIIGGENKWVNRAKWLINEPMILISRVYVENRNSNLIYPGQIPVCASNAFICFKSNKKAKLKYLWYKLNAPKFINYMIQHVRGTIHPSVNLNDFLNYKLQLPDLHIQQKIIDIIEPKEKLFLQFPNCVRIDSFENCKKDLQNLIDIIEPILKMKNCLDIIMKKIKSILVKNYQINNNSRVSLKAIINTNVSKRTNQNIYFHTSAVGELKLFNEKAIYLETKTISRANLIPKENSILFSKLKGENKVLPFVKGKKEWVFSTGFYNITSNANDHILGFLLSSYFQDQKNIYATGTTMKGLNSRDLFKIRIKKPLYFTNCFLALLEKQIFLINLLSKIQNQIIDLLIK